MAKWLVIVGLILMIVGVLLHYMPWNLNWFGKLPGDIHIKLENGRIYIPVVSMLIISVLLSLIINIVKRL